MTDRQRAEALATRIFGGCWKGSYHEAHIDAMERALSAVRTETRAATILECSDMCAVARAETRAATVEECAKVADRRAEQCDEDSRVAFSGGQEAWRGLRSRVSALKNVAEAIKALASTERK